MALSGTMLCGGPGAQADGREQHPLELSRGLGLREDLLIDSHFGQRGRFGRLLGAVAPAPALLGIGIDEDTDAIVDGRDLRVVGAGAVYLVDLAERSDARSDEARPSESRPCTGCGCTS